MSDVRVRIAPSPSGFLHIGTARTALFNWLYARKTGGTFVLRLEDTDASRTSEEFVEGVCEGFSWLGIVWDEGPAFGTVTQKGDFGPYRQSKRKDVHVREAHRLVEEGKAYKCFCSREALDAEKEKAIAEKRNPHYNGKCRNLTSEEIAAKGDAPFTIRFKVNPGSTSVDDLVQGVVTVNNDQFDDFIIVRPNGYPMFHLAVVVDDGLMKITHVIRGDDHLTNASRHVMLFEALGYKVPKFAHLPMVLDENGKKYSKRLHGANVLDWREDGYLPEALINYVALLGWSPEEENRELFTREELIEAFSLERVNKSGSKFDLKKLQWLNGQHIRMLPLEELCDRCVAILNSNGFDTSGKSREWLLHMTSIVQEKLRTLNEIIVQTDFFFVEPTEYEEKGVQKQWLKDDALDRMQMIRDTLSSVQDWTHDALKDAYQALCEKTGDGLGKFVHPTRLALSGKSVGPGLFELVELLGKETSLARMDKAMDYLKTLGEDA